MDKDKLTFGSNNILAVTVSGTVRESVPILVSLDWVQNSDSDVAGYKLFIMEVQEVVMIIALM